VIGVDTNILLRIFETEDDPAQSLRARKVIEEHAPVYLHDVVLAEFVWTCRNAFKQSRQAIRRRLQAIADSTEFVVGRPEVFARAVEAYGSRESDFADWLVGLSNLDNGLEFTLTFDKNAARRRAFGMVDARGA
jgi:predicted nucleic-acid-binding protein